MDSSENTSSTWYILLGDVGRMSTLRVDSIQGQTADGTNRYVVQVVSTTKTDTFSANSAQIQAVTGLSVSITPSNTNNKVLNNG